MEQVQNTQSSVTVETPAAVAPEVQDAHKDPKKSSNVLIILFIGIALLIVGLSVFAYSRYQNSLIVDYAENKIEVYSSVDSEAPESNEYNQIIENGEELEIDGISDLPTPPEGMRWTYCSNVEAYLLSPDGWFKKEETLAASDTEACFISKESIEYGGDFETGLSINMIRDVQSITAKSDLEYAKSFIDKLAEEFDSSVESGGDGVHFEGFSTGVSSKDSSGNIINAYYLALASMDTDKLYIFWYEGPSDEWDILWPLGRDMLLNLALESE